LPYANTEFIEDTEKIGTIGKMDDGKWIMEGVEGLIGNWLFGKANCLLAHG
jgi:hypothetical protein